MGARPALRYVQHAGLVRPGWLGSYQRRVHKILSDRDRTLEMYYRSRRLILIKGIKFCRFLNFG